MIQEKKKAAKLFAPQGYLKATIYIGSEHTLVKDISDEMKSTGMKFSPLMIHAFKLFHALNPDIERAAADRGITAAELINQAVAGFLKKR